MKIVNTIARLFAIGLLAALPATGGAQTISQLTDAFVTGAGSAAGQSFTATTTGFVVGVDVRSNTSVIRTFYLYNGAVGSGVLNVVGAPAYTQPGVTLTGVGSGGAFSHVTLTTPFPVVAGSAYTFMLGGGGTAVYNNANVYAGGSAVFNYGTPAGGDLAFQVDQVADPVPAPASPAIAVPTLSQWALLLLAGLMAGAAVLQMKREPRRARQSCDDLL